jgi:arabinose-5-phosphate isomerase
VVEREKLVGVISDGDLRRLLEKRGKDAMELTARDCMTRSPQTISTQQFASAALNIMEQRKITSLVVVDASGNVQGVVHLHDLWGMEML